jgi:hypothetical protein
MSCGGARRDGMVLAAPPEAELELCRFDTGHVDQNMPMMPVTAILGSSAADASRPSRAATTAPHQAKTADTRAVIPLQPATRSDGGLNTRPQADFLAHLIATDRQLPQTRERRRAEPADAIAAYAAAGRKRSRTGRRLFRAA